MALPRLLIQVVMVLAQTTFRAMTAAYGQALQKGLRNHAHEFTAQAGSSSAANAGRYVMPLEMAQQVLSLDRSGIKQLHQRLAQERARKAQEMTNMATAASGAKAKRGQKEHVEANTTSTDVTKTTEKVDPEKEPTLDDIEIPPLEETLKISPELVRAQAMRLFEQNAPEKGGSQFLQGKIAGAKDTLEQAIRDGHFD